MDTQKFTLRKATENDIDAVYQVMLKTYEALSDKSLFVCDDYDYVKENTLNTGFTVVACNECGEIVADFIFRYPADSEDNLGLDLNLKPSDLPKVIHTESCTVLPAYRGHGLQSKMLAYAETLVDKTRYHYLLATVSPDNPASYKSLEKNGFTHALTKEKYGGLLRRIYVKEL